jgi:hypothetical protein
VGGRSQRHRPKSNKPPSGKTDEKAARQAALEYERTERQHESARRKEESARAKERQRREQATAKAEATLDKANESMTPRQAPSRPSGPPWKSDRKPRTRVGKSRRRTWRPLCAGRGNGVPGRAAGGYRNERPGRLLAY